MTNWKHIFVAVCLLSTGGCTSPERSAAPDSNSSTESANSKPIPASTTTGIATATPVESAAGTVPAKADPRKGTLTASPNPILDHDVAAHGLTTLSWTTEGVSLVEIRLGAPDGKLFAHMGPSGSAPTGQWVVDGMEFYLQDVSDSRPLTAENTLCILTVNVKK